LGSSCLSLVQEVINAMAAAARRKPRIRRIGAMISYWGARGSERR
jgi:hypothetical protein